MKRTLLILLVLCAPLFMAADRRTAMRNYTSGSAAWSPTTPANTLREWIKADVGLGLNNGDPVSTWTASAGKSPTASGSARPFFTNNVQNGLPAIQFDGVNDYMDTGNFTSSQAQPYTVLMVFKLITTASQARLIDGDTAGTGRLILRSGGNWNVYSGSAFQNTAQSEDTNFNTLLLEVNGTTSTNSWNGGATDNFAGTSPGTDNLPGIGLGCSNDGSTQPAKMFWCELIVWDGRLSTADRTSALSYIRTRWATW